MRSRPRRLINHTEIKNKKYILQKEHQHLLLLGKSNLHLIRLNHYVMSHVNTIDIMKTHFIAFYIQMS